MRKSALYLQMKTEVKSTLKWGEKSYGVLFRWAHYKTILVILLV